MSRIFINENEVILYSIISNYDNFNLNALKNENGTNKYNSTWDAFKGELDIYLNEAHIGSNHDKHDRKLMQIAINSENIDIIEHLLKSGVSTILNIEYYFLMDSINPYREIDEKFLFNEVTNPDIKKLVAKYAVYELLDCKRYNKDTSLYIEEEDIEEAMAIAGLTNHDIRLDYDLTKVFPDILEELDQNTNIENSII